jgi:hypothetical protein
MVFLNSPYRETPRSLPQKKTRKQQPASGWVVWDLANARGGPSIFFLPAKEVEEKKGNPT